MKTRTDNFNKPTRVIGDIHPDEIIGVSFAEEGEQENTPSKEDFLKEYELRMARP